MTTVLCDLSEVLIAGLLGVERQLAPLVSLSGREFLAALAHPTLGELFRGRISEECYLSQLVERQGWDLPVETLKQQIRLNFHRQVEGTLDIVSELAVSHPVVLVSDHAREWIAYITAIHPFLSLFDRTFYSYEYGYLKREPEAFGYVLDCLRVTPEECLLIDDSETNTTVAAGLGIATIRFTTATALAQRLAEMGLR
jgi:FMN phosphatase YigB (HAD superfamily)